MQDASSTVVVAAGQASLTQTQGIGVTLPVSGVTFTPSVTGAACLSYSVNTTSSGTITAYLQTLSDFADSDSPQVCLARLRKHAVRSVTCPTLHWCALQGFSAAQQVPVPGSVSADTTQAQKLVAVDPSATYLLVVLADAGNDEPVAVLLDFDADIAGSAGDSDPRFPTQLAVLRCLHVRHVMHEVQPSEIVQWCAACSGVAAAPAALVTQLQPGTVAAQSLQLPVQPIQQPPVCTWTELQVLRRWSHVNDSSLCLQYMLDGFELSFRETKPVITLDNATCVAYQILRTAASPSDACLPADLHASTVLGQESDTKLFALQRNSQTQRSWT